MTTALAIDATTYANAYGAAPSGVRRWWFEINDLTGKDSMWVAPEPCTYEDAVARLVRRVAHLERKYGITCERIALGC